MRVRGFGHETKSFILWTRNEADRGFPVLEMASDESDSALLVEFPYEFQSICETCEDVDFR